MAKRINMLNNVQRLSLEEYISSEMEKVDTPLSDIKGKDIVWSAWKHVAALISGIGSNVSMRTQSKKLPFPAKFQQHTITDPYQVYEAFDHAETMQDCHTIIIDSVTFLMDMYESLYVLPKAGTKEGMTAWGQFAQYFKTLMQQYVAKSTKNVIMTAHTFTDLNEDLGAMQTKVPIKGALKNQGIEAYFSIVVSTKKVPIAKLENYGSDLLNITAEEEALGYKHCFQTKMTKETLTERMRAPMGMFNLKESFMDNDAQLLLDRLHTYYN